MITIPDDILINYLTPEEMEDIESKNMGIFSITVYAEKPGGKSSENHSDDKQNKKEACCGPESNCC